MTVLVHQAVRNYPYGESKTRETESAIGPAQRVLPLPAFADQVLVRRDRRQQARQRSRASACKQQRDAAQRQAQKASGAGVALRRWGARACPVTARTWGRVSRELRADASPGSRPAVLRSARYYGEAAKRDSARAGHVAHAILLELELGRGDPDAIAFDPAPCRVPLHLCIQSAMPGLMSCPFLGRVHSGAVQRGSRRRRMRTSSRCADTS